jgi:response regulator RpfG family c-di-GMP phosphodiesterase
MDVQMPKLDGLQATRQIRAMAEPKRSIPIIALTANAMIGAREEYLAAGMSDYISKPVQVGLLLSKVAAVAAKAARPQAAQTGVQSLGFTRPAPEDQAALLDLEKLTELEKVFSPPQLINFITLTLVDMELHLARIGECGGRNDFEGVLRQAHIIVGIAGNLGAMRASAAARQLEAACRSADQALCGPLIEVLNSACELSSKVLRDWSDQRPANRPEALAS